MHNGKTVPLKKKIDRFRNTVYAYYGKNGRILPWRETVDPYHILVLEIIQSCKFSVFLLVLLVSCGFKNTRIAQEFKAVELQTLEGHSDYVKSVAFSPDGNYLASGSRDETIKLWQLSGSKFLQFSTRIVKL